MTDTDLTEEARALVADWTVPDETCRRVALILCDEPVAA